MKLRLGHQENLPTLSLEPSAPRASNLACSKDKRLSSLSQLQMVIAAVVLRGRTPKPSHQININLAECNEVGHSIHCSGSVFCNVCLCDCNAPNIPCSQQQVRVRAIYSGMAVRWRDKCSITCTLKLVYCVLSQTSELMYCKCELTWCTHQACSAHVQGDWFGGCYWHIRQIDGTNNKTTLLGEESLITCSIIQRSYDHLMTLTCPTQLVVHNHHD